MVDSILVGRCKYCRLPETQPFLHKRKRFMVRMCPERKQPQYISKDHVPSQQVIDEMIQHAGKCYKGCSIIMSRARTDHFYFYVKRQVPCGESCPCKRNAD